MLGRIKKIGKKQISVLQALACVALVLAAVATIAATGSGTVDFWARTIMPRYIQALPGHSQVEVKSPISWSPSSGGRLHPVNLIKNSELGVWSGGSRYGIASGGALAVPDGWARHGSNTGVSLVSVSDTDPGSGSTVWAGFQRAIYLENRNTTTGAGNTQYFTYPDAESGISTQAKWYQQFIGKRVVFGFAVKMDKGQYEATGVTTSFIRPFINTYASAGYLAGESSFAFGPYASQHTNEWQVLTGTTTVPEGATALEVGIAMNPTVLAAAAATGDSAYVVGPFLYIDPSDSNYSTVPQEVIFLKSSAKFQQSPFNLAGAGTSSFSVPTDTAGKLPPEAKAYLVSLIGEMPSASGTFQVAFRRDTTDTNGVTHYPSGFSGTSLWNVQTWVPLDHAGSFDLFSSHAVTGVSIYVIGVMM